MPAQPSTTHRGPTRPATRIARVTAVFLSTLALVLGLAPAAMAQSGSTRIGDFTFNVSVNSGGSDLRPGGHVRLDITATNTHGTGFSIASNRVLNTYGFVVPTGYTLRSSGGDHMSGVGNHSQGGSYWGGGTSGFGMSSVQKNSSRSGWLSFNIPSNAQGGSPHQFGVRANLENGDIWFPTASNVVRFTLPAVGTSTSMTVNPTAVRVGEETTLSARVSSAAGSSNTPTGRVNFSVDGRNLSANVVNGVATTTATFDTAGNFPVTASFQPSSTTQWRTSSNAGTVRVQTEATQTNLTLDPVEVVEGDKIVASANVNPAGAEGEIEFTTGEDTVRVPVEADGSASTELAASAAGPMTVTATFIPANSERYSTSSDSQTIDVSEQIATETALTVDTNPARVGEESTLTATVTPAAAEGTVTFTIDDQTYPVTVSGGTATLAHTFTTTGQHAVTADFAPTDTNRYTTSSGQVTVNVNTETTQTDLTLNPIEVTAGGEITATAQITPADATGQVRFDYADQTRTVPVTGGTATATFTAEAAGTETVTATFLPTDPARYSESSDSQTVDATAEATQTTLTLDPMSVVTDGTILASARVTPAGVEGTIEFTTGEDTVRVPVAVDGTATTELTAGPAGPMTVTATFIPANAERYSGSSDSKTVDVFEQISTQTSITVDSGGIAVDDEVTLTATVTPSTASGTVTFTIGEQTYPVAVSDGIATLSHTFSTTGQHSIAAEFAPTDADRYTSSNDSLDVLVSEGTVDPASTTVSFDSVTSELGDAVTLTATVTPVDAAGDVVFTINGVKHTATVVGGVATLTHSADELGDHTVEVEFLPSDTEAYAPSTDAGTLTVVEDAGPGEDPDEPGAGSLGSLSLVAIIGSVVMGFGSAGSLGSVFS